MDAVSNAQQILRIANRIRELSGKLPELAMKTPQAEYDYQTGASKAHFLLRQNGIAQGDAKEYVKGLDEELVRLLGVKNLPLVAELRLQRDLAEALEDANKRALRATETELSGYQSVQRDFKEL